MSLCRILNVIAGDTFNPFHCLIFDSCQPAIPRAHFTPQANLIVVNIQQSGALNPDVNVLTATQLSL